jgi:RimJ/RimL family protein N-acetyltransferase
MGVLVAKGSGLIIGLAGLLQCSELGRKDYEIGFVLAQKFWGKGYATEIGIAQIEYGLEVIGCERLLALVAPGNAASRSVIRKIGMRHHSTVDTESRGLRDVYVTVNHA